ncbi:mannose-specific lectin-like [Dendrobium catenatum]|uniref:Mannose-specific lectin n=1 Tax=Dendrobium catenatum TaxID=906689 RepID=A0A2I0VA67_9ASPA|nr:mannose-specific lectin-like [Dendrobium catenatum]PKU60305.1 Mannose-specific lectin [Dendrobium catenatum]
MAFFSMIKILLLCVASLSALLLATPVSGQSPSYLLSGNRIDAGRFIKDNLYYFTIQYDCNLVLLYVRNILWSSGTDNKGSGCYVSLESNGNLIIYDNQDQVVWESGTNGAEGRYILILLRSGNSAHVELFGPSIWDTQPAGKVVVATALNGTMGVSRKEQNKARKMGKIMEVMSDE